MGGSHRENFLHQLIMSIKHILLEPLTRISTHVRSSTLPHELKTSACALLSSTPTGGKHTLPNLPYDYNALEPTISSETMSIHHTKHHNTYVSNLNIALQELDSAVHNNEITKIVSLQDAIKFNGGGHLNHILFWDNLTPTSKPIKDFGMLNDSILDSFGTVDGMKEKLIQKSSKLQGSGWGWLAYNSINGKLEVTTTKNQDPLLATTGLIPLLGVDVWEHAYYVDYRNNRHEYLIKLLNKIVNWDIVEDRLKEAIN